MSGTRSSCAAGRAWTVLLAILLVTGCARYRPSAIDTRSELEQAQRALLAALTAQDLDGTVAHFADDAVLHVAGMPAVKGVPAIRRFYENVFRFLASSESQPEILRMASGGDMAYGVGTVVNSFRGERSAVAFTGKFLLVWERRGGTWKAVAYGITSDQPEPAGRPRSEHRSHGGSP